MTGKHEISRVTRSKQQAMTTYDQISRWYDWFSAGSEQPLAELGLKKLKTRVGEIVLEIGPGTGNAIRSLANGVGDSGRVVGIDISRGMLELANKKISRSNLSPRVALGQGDAATLPFKRDCFDAVFISFTLELFDTPEIPTVLSECRRVLKPEGRLAVVAMARDDFENLPLRIYDWFHHHLPAYVDCRPIFVQPELALAGFQIKEISRKHVWGLPVEICIAYSP